MKAVMLAGGVGVSASPYNTIYPKPMLPVGDVPILELGVRHLKNQGITDFTIVVGHVSAAMIKCYFEDGSRLGVNITYAEEPKPCGNAGALSCIEENPEETFLVMNGDVVTTLDIGKVIEFHRENKPAMTMAANKKDIYIDFGFIEMDQDNQVQAYTEKPTLHTQVNMGVYIMEPQVMSFIPKHEYFNISNLTAALQEKNEAVMVYEDDCYWLDISYSEDYDKANKDFEEMKSHFIK